MIHRFFVALSAAVLLPAAAPPADPAKAFGSRESILDISLSPSGKKLAFIEPGPGQSTVLYTVATDGSGQPKKAGTADGKPERLSSCGWVSEVRLVCTVFLVMDDTGDMAGKPVGVTRLIALNEDGSNMKMLSRPARPDDIYVSFGGGSIIDWLPGDDGAVIMGREYVPEHKAASRMTDKREGFGADRIDTNDLGSKPVEAPKKNASRYISDGRGTIRIMAMRDIAGGGGYASGKTIYHYRAKGSRDWKDLSTYDSITSEGFRPVAVDPDLDVAYGFKVERGRNVLYSMALDGTKKETRVFAHPHVDVSGTVRIGRGQRVVGAAYSTDKPEAVYFDPELERLAKALSKALPGLPLIHFADSSADEKKLLLWAGSDVDPGRYYLFDKDTKQLNELMLARPQLEGATLAPMKHVTYKAADGTDVPAYLTMPAGGATKGLPAIVMPHGGPSARDEWGFDWLVQYFASRGYAVLQPNYRGSAGYGEAWFQNNGFQSWKTAIGDVNDAGRWLVKEGIADPAKLGIVGWSYGGYAALQSGVLDPDLFKAVVAVAPVTDLGLIVEEARTWSNSRVVASFIGSGPHVREGSPAQNADKIKAPVLMFHGTHDLNVAVHHAKLMEDRLKAAGKKAELVVYPALDHGLDDTAARQDMLTRTDAFLRAAMNLR